MLESIRAALFCMWKRTGANMVNTRLFCIISPSFCLVFPCSILCKGLSIISSVKKIKYLGKWSIKKCHSHSCFLGPPFYAEAWFPSLILMFSFSCLSPSSATSPVCLVFSTGPSLEGHNETHSFSWWCFQFTFSSMDHLTSIIIICWSTFIHSTKSLCEFHGNNTGKSGNG